MGYVESEFRSSYSLRYFCTLDLTCRNPIRANVRSPKNSAKRHPIVAVPNRVCPTKLAKVYSALLPPSISAAPPDQRNAANRPIEMSNPNHLSPFRIWPIRVNAILTNIRSPKNSPSALPKNAAPPINKVDLNSIPSSTNINATPMYQSVATNRPIAMFSHMNLSPFCKSTKRDGAPV